MLHIYIDGISNGIINGIAEFVLNAFIEIIAAAAAVFIPCLILHNIDKDKRVKRRAAWINAQIGKSDSQALVRTYSDDDTWNYYILILDTGPQRCIYIMSCDDDETAKCKNLIFRILSNTRYRKTCKYCGKPQNRDDMKKYNDFFTPQYLHGNVNEYHSFMH